MNIYLFFGVVFAFTASFLSTYHYKNNIIDGVDLTDEDYAKIDEELTILFTFTIFVLIAIPSTIFASKRILRKGISDDVRKSVISRHIKYILILVLTFVFYAQKIIVEIFFGKTETAWLDEISVYIFASQGIFLSILRLSEPLVWRTFKNKMKATICCCFNMSQDPENEYEETLSTFLATSFNVELVYIILKGITEFTKEVKQIELGKACEHKSKIKRKIDKSLITLKEIKIKDP